MKTKTLLFCGLCLLGLASCDFDNSFLNAFDEYQGYQEKSNPKVAEKKPAIFYQQMLDVFCQRYYNDAFNRTYHCNSLIVDGMDITRSNWEGEDIISWNVKVEGKHSFEGFLKNHNDSPFRAIIDDLGDNTYKVSFYIRRYGPFGELMDGEECATRIITYYE